LKNSHQEIKQRHITVIVPVGRIDGYLIETLKSIANQTYKDYDVIFICRVTDMVELQECLKNQSVPFEWQVIGAKLGGFAFALNLGLNCSCGQFIARWDADDLCDNNRFERQIQAFEEDPFLCVIGTKVELIDENGILIKNHKFKFFSDNLSIRNALRYRQTFAHSAVMFRSSILYQYKGYLYGNSCEDHELYIRLARNLDLKFANLGDVVTYYRRHNNQLTTSGKEYEQFCDICAFLISEFLRSGHPMYLIGCMANHSFARKGRHLFRQLMQKFG